MISDVSTLIQLALAFGGGCIFIGIFYHRFGNVEKKQIEDGKRFDEVDSAISKLQNDFEGFKNKQAYDMGILQGKIDSMIDLMANLLKKDIKI